MSKRPAPVNASFKDVFGVKEQSEALIKSEDQKHQNTLYKLNVAAFIVHLISFCAGLGISIAYIGNSYLAELSTAFRVYDQFSSNPPNAGKFSIAVNTLSFYELDWVLISFPLITAIFHAIVIFGYREKYYRWVFKERRNPIRWIEYSITAGIMTWVVMQMSAITDVVTLVTLGLLGNIALQIQGYLTEKTENVWPMVAGWIIFVAQWIVIASFFFAAITSPRPPSVDQVPWFVYTSVIGLFFMFASFGFVQLAQYNRLWIFKSGYICEVAYVSLSLTAKLFLTWVVLIGILTI